jgi:hypothetical protein
VKKKLNLEKIVDAAWCRRDEHGVYCVESPEFDMLLGAAETEGRAWQIFFELLDESLSEYKKGRLSGYDMSAARILGRKGGAAKTDAKKRASRENGKKGGRPAGAKVS